MKTSVVILAAGLGTRMRSKQAKVLHRAGGLALVEHVVLAAGAVTSRDRIVVVTGHQADTVEALLKPMGIRFARQVQQKGTGHAVMCAREQLQKADAKWLTRGVVWRHSSVVGGGGEAIARGTDQI
jgi:bifunctional UDP-N-acetylglucosamine pyrophosphorylase/glucosamine-1-phosphate N-acetyltransferase